MRKKIADLINIVFGFRKFIAWLGIFLTAIIFRLNDLVDGAQFVDLMKNTFLAFVTANGVEHVIGAVKSYADTKSTGDDPRTPYEDLVSLSAQEAEDLKKEHEHA